MNRNKHIIIIVFLFFLSGVSYYAKSNSTKLDTVKLQLSYFHQFQFAGFYAAQAKGFYRDEGLYVKIYEKASNVNSVFNVVSQKANFGIAKGNIIRQNLEGTKIVLLKVIYQHSPYTIITLKKNNIRKPSDLVGKKLMLSNSKLPPQLYSMFKNEGVNTDKLLLVQHSYNYDDLILGKVDAASGHTTVQPYYIEQKGYEPYCIYPADYGADFYGAMLFTSEKEIKEHKERVDKFIKASMKGWEYAYKNIEEIVDIILLLPTKNPDKPTKDLLLYEAKASKECVLPDIVELGHINPVRIAKMAEIFKEKGDVPKDAKLDDNFIYDPNKYTNFFNSERFYLFLTIIAVLIVLFLIIILILRFIIKNKTKKLKLEISEGKRKEQELIDSEEKYRALFNSAGEAILIMDKNRFITCNPKTLEVFDCTEEEIINKSFSKFSPKYQPDKRISEEKIKEKITLCLANQPQTFDWKLTRYNGTKFDAEIRLTKLVFADKIRILAIIRDITDSKLKAEAIKESEEKFSKIFHNNPIPILLTDMEKGTILDCNKSFLNASEFSRKELIGKTPEQLDLWENPNDRNKFIAEIYKNHSINGKYYKFRTKNKKVIHCLVSAEIIKINERNIVLGAYRIINDLLEKDSIIKEIQLKFAKIFELSPTAIIITSLDDGKILDINNKGLAIFGVTRNEVTNKTIVGFNFWEKKSEKERYLKTLKEQGFIKDLEATFVNKNGEIIPCSISAEIIELNNAQYILCTLWDLRKIKKRERELQKALKTVRELKQKLLKENILLKEELNNNFNFENIITNSSKVKKELQKIQKVAPTNTTVLILGETGTGKELFARTIHRLSNKADKPLVKVNCASLPSNLIESELFGHEKGAFTGAIKQHIGRFELANNATIFLDEVGELPIEVQSKLLRVLQEGEFERVGSSITLKTNARIIAASNRDLQKMISLGTFREDLFYRLNVFPINTIPLRERPEDIEPLVNNFITQISARIGKKITSVEKTGFEALLNYSFPGNVRELQNIIERAIIETNSTVIEISLPLKNDNSYSENRKISEKDMIIAALVESNWKIEGKNGAAIKLKIAPSTLRDKIKKYNLKKP